MTPEQKVKTLEMLITMTGFNGISTMRAYQETYHESLDWHEFGYYLDELHTKKLIRVTGFSRDGMTQYAWNKEKE